MIRSIKIIHDEMAAGAYRFLADFFRLVGVFVSGYTSDRDDDDSDYTQVIVIRDFLNEKVLEHFRKKYSGEDLDGICKLVEMDEIRTEYDSADYKQYLATCLVQMRKNLEDSGQIVLDEDVRALNHMVSVYADNDLMRWRSIYTYFFEYKEITQSAQDHLTDAYIQLINCMNMESEKGIPLSRYCIYTQMNLAKCINETCNFLKQRLIFDVEKCLDRLEWLLAEHPSFYNVYILQAFLAETDMKYVKQCEGYYQNAMFSLGDHSYMSYPRYRLGRYYERLNVNRELSIENYEKAYQLNQYEYRAIYKLMLVEKDKGHYWNVIGLCRQTCNILHKQEEADYLQPREHEYLYKAYAEKALIYEKFLPDPKEREKAVNQKKDICWKLNTGANHLYRQIFREQADELSKKTAKRLSTTVERCIRQN